MGDTGLAEETVCDLEAEDNAGQGVGIIVVGWLLSPLPWVVEYSLVETSLHFSGGILELSCPVSLETEHSLSSSLLHLYSWSL